MTWLDRE
jgi:hypothetical protein